MSNMPILPVEAMVIGLSDCDAGIVRAAFTGRGVQDNWGRLKTNKPFKRVTTFEEGCANYVWRMLCFDLVGHGKHACMPVCADFDLSDAQEVLEGRRVRYTDSGYDEYKGRSKELRDRMDALVKTVEAPLPVECKKGLLRWGRALGIL